MLVVLKDLALGRRLLAQGVQALLGAEAVIRRALFNQELRIFPINFFALALHIRAEVPADVRRAAAALIPEALKEALDTAKAVANLLTNPGKAEDYQGWELVKNPAVYKIGIPTLSGTGSECSRTCVLTNIPKNLKLGMNSDYTVYDQLLLDPDLLATVPRNQYFYTGIDTFMHCIESLQGSYRNAIIDAFSVRAVQLCEEIFLSDDMMSEENREKMMIASYIGGMAAGNVGVIHPFSAGLGVVLHVAHGLGNCLALNVLGDIYPKEYKQFRTMIERQGVSLPTGICKDLTEEQYDGLYRGCIVHEKPLTNALGPGFKQILTKENLIERYKSI